jgi:ribosomal protein S13
MAKRKTKRLGSSAEMHRAAAVDLRENARRSAEFVRTDLGRGDCRRAIEQLVAAAEYSGMAHSEASGAEGQPVRGNRRDRTIGQLTTRVIEACAKTKK